MWEYIDNNHAATKKSCIWFVSLSRFIAIIFFTALEEDVNNLNI